MARLPWLVVLAVLLPLVSVAHASRPTEAGEGSDTTKVPLSWSEYFTQDFYHRALVPLLLATVVLAWAARPSTSEEVPKDFRRFQWRYLSVWALCVAADWLQGPYVYALYAAYGYSSKEIGELFVAGFGASMVFGCFVGSVTDKFGRKRCCIMYCLLYIASCMTKHFQHYGLLLVGRVTGGIATSMLFSCFECWMVSEHMVRNSFPTGLLGYMFGMMFTVMYCVAIASGLAGQAVADAFVFGPWSKGAHFHTGGPICPFDLASALLCVATVLITVMWEENYGTSKTPGEHDAVESASLWENLRQAASMLATDRRVLLLCAVVSAFEGSMFAFVFNWTPALASKVTPPPHGVIFALFMMACMCGASAATLLGKSMKPGPRLVGVCAAGLLAFVVASQATAGNVEDHLILTLSTFLVFEFCVGLYFPTIGVLKSEIVPEKVRGTVYNIYRVPLNAIVVCLILSSISLATCFKLNAFLLLVALGSVLAISTSKAKSSPEYEVVGTEMGESRGRDQRSTSPNNSPNVIGRMHHKGQPADDLGV